jgi:hypothetical protein
MEGMEKQSAGNCNGHKSGGRPWQLTVKRGGELIRLVEGIFGTNRHVAILGKMDARLLKIHASSFKNYGLGVSPNFPGIKRFSPCLPSRVDQTTREFFKEMIDHLLGWDKIEEYYLLLHNYV